jgi:hypothetical protein
MPRIQALNPAIAIDAFENYLAGEEIEFDDAYLKHSTQNNNSCVGMELRGSSPVQRWEEEPRPSKQYTEPSRREPPRPEPSWQHSSNQYSDDHIAQGASNQRNSALRQPPDCATNGATPFADSAPRTRTMQPLLDEASLPPPPPPMNDPAALRRSMSSVRQARAHPSAHAHPRAGAPTTLARPRSNSPLHPPRARLYARPPARTRGARGGGRAARGEGEGGRT